MSDLAYCFPSRRYGRVDECARFERESGVKLIGGSNPSISAGPPQRGLLIRCKPSRPGGDQVSTGS